MIIKCLCGCENKLDEFDKYGRKRKGYVYGHVMKGRKRNPLTIEQRRNISEGTKLAMQNLSPEKKEILRQQGLKHLGRKRPRETGLKISKALKGRKHSEEVKRKMSLAHIGKPSGMKGKKLSEETKQKIKLSKIIANPKYKEWRKTQILPKGNTKIEVKIQNYLRELNIEFFTHQYIKEIEHGYQCDIFIPLLNLVIECDGDYWHKYPTGKEIDHIRTKELLEKGFKVLRLWEIDIKNMTLEDLKTKLIEVK